MSYPYRLFVPPPLDDTSVNGLLFVVGQSPFMNLYDNWGGVKTETQDIAVFVDGACSHNGQHWASAGMGVFFGYDSRHNISQRLDYGPQTNQRAAINAAILALERVKELLDYGRLRTDVVVVATDSAYLVGAITNWIYKWQGNGWKTTRGGKVANREDFEQLDGLVDELEDDYGVNVKFWKVDREDNQEADELAKDAVD